MGPTDTRKDQTPDRLPSTPCDEHLLSLEPYQVQAFVKRTGLDGSRNQQQMQVLQGHELGESASVIDFYTQPDLFLTNE